MQGCKYEVYPWWCQRTYLNCNANVFSKRWRCKDLMVQMPSNGHVMMQMLLVGMSWCQCSLVGMSWCECLLGSMPWCKCSYSACHDANVPLVHAMMRMSIWVCNECECPLVGIPWHGMLWCKHNSFKNSFYFQNEASTTPETKIFSNSIYYS